MIMLFREMGLSYENNEKHINALVLAKWSFVKFLKICSLLLSKSFKPLTSYKSAFVPIQH
jgi:hypothetical protein